VQVDEPMILRRLEELRRSADTEAVWRDQFGRDGTAYVMRLLSGAPGLYSRVYGKGRNSVICVSKEPLPDYRADLDTRFGKQQTSVGMSTGGQAMVRSLLARSDADGHVPASRQPGRPQSAQHGGAGGGGGGSRRRHSDVSADALRDARAVRAASAQAREQSLQAPSQGQTDVADAWDDSSGSEDGSADGDERGGAGAGAGAGAKRKEPDGGATPKAADASAGGGAGGGGADGAAGVAGRYVPPSRRGEATHTHAPAGGGSGGSGSGTGGGGGGGGGQQSAAFADASAKLLEELRAKRQSAQYLRMQTFRKKLPSYSRREGLIAALRASQVRKHPSPAAFL
jgi:hypothetical protein